MNPPANDCFVLLDDSGASADDRRSRLYTGYRATLESPDASHLPALLQQMERELKQGLHAVGLFNYEAGLAAHGLVAHGAPVARILLFTACRAMSSAEVDDWLATRAQAAMHKTAVLNEQQAGIAHIKPSVTQQAFFDAIARIRAWLAAGDAYQVNYTYRLRFDAYGAPEQLYQRLRARQPVPYGALVVLPDGGALLSLSPELFLRHAHGELAARPMKGTAEAGANQHDDAARAVALASDPKNRSENLMIVDLLRNDLGKVAVPGSVAVPQLFHVARHGAVLQMTSTITARVRAGLGLTDVFAALYPCGSITGAPKRRAMQIIDELEADPRGIYTGAIGWFDAAPLGQAIGDFCLSVPIRTLALEPPSANGTRRGALGIGAGIVYDSDAAEEYAECLLKARFLTGLDTGFELIETNRSCTPSLSGCTLSTHSQDQYPIAASPSSAPPVSQT